MFSYLKKKFSPHTASSSALERAAKKANMIMLIIDPQMDFHPPNGTLGVPGAQEDSERTAAFIREHIDEIDDIFVTLDSHHVRHTYFY
jgi:nicotinamidase-related amidase